MGCHTGSCGGKNKPIRRKLKETGYTTTTNLTVTTTEMDVVTALGGAFFGYTYGDSLIPGLGGVWGGAVGATLGGGMMSALLGTQFGTQWLANVNTAVNAMIDSPLQAIAVWFTALILFDTGWDYAFEFFDPVFDIIFEFLPGGSLWWGELNPFGGGFLGFSAISAAILTFGAYDYIGWPMSCMMWSLCVMMAQAHGQGCTDYGTGGSFPCPGGALTYECPDQYGPAFFRGNYHDDYNVTTILGDLAHMAMIPFAMPLCMVIQTLRGASHHGGSCPKPGVMQWLMLPVLMVQEFMKTSGALMLDVAYLPNKLSDPTRILTHFVNELKCKSYGLGYC